MNDSRAIPGPKSRRAGALPMARVQESGWERFWTNLRASLPEAGRFGGLSLLTLLLFSVIFPPTGLWTFAFVCLTPWAVGVLATQRAWIVHWGSFLLGYVFFLINLRWLMPVTGIGYAALAAYLAVYWVMAGWALRTAARLGIGATWTLPVVWVATEYLRGWVMSGFPWLFVGHALYRQIPLIQVADLAGAYGVTFVALAVSGALADVALGWGRRQSLRSRAVPLAGAGLVLLATLGYGYWRLAGSNLRQGPRVAVIQESFPLVSKPPYGEHQFVMLARSLALAAEAARERPDLIVLPETAWSSIQNIGFLSEERQALPDLYAGEWAFGKHAHDATAAFARGDYATVNRIIAFLEQTLNRNRRGGANQSLPRLKTDFSAPTPLVVGSVSIDLLPDDPQRQHQRCNSALVYDADGRQREERYDKVHLVPFGEFVPFRNQVAFGVNWHWLYRWLNSLSPFSHGGKIDYSLAFGRRFTDFELTTPAGRSRFGVPICYEDVMPYIARRFVWGDDGQRRVDFLLNISNDGWFLFSAELEQHLSICVFRAVENRVGIARAVNTGISGFIDPDGRVYSLVSRNGRTVGEDVIGYAVDHVKLDQRASLYGRWGDWFAKLCLLLSAALWCGGIVSRWVRSLVHVVRRGRGEQSEPAAE